MSSLVFLSHPVSEETPSYGNRDKISISPKSFIKNGEGANTSFISFSNNHMGTHIDTPFHFCNDGKKTLEYNASEFYFKKIGLIKIPCTNAKLIDVNDLIGFDIDRDIDILLIQTGYENFRKTDKYHNDNPGIDPSVADFLRANYKSLRAVGFDFISLTSWKFRPEGREAHRTFLCSDPSILVIEDISFYELGESEIDWLLISPLRSTDGNGGPVTITAKLF